MAYISKEDYISISAEYSSARDSIVSAKSNFWNAVYEIVMLQDVRPEVDLLSIFYDTYEVESNKLTSVIPFMGAVRALNQHVLNEAGVDTIAEFLDSTPVNPTWITLCEFAGFDMTGVVSG